MVSLISCAPKIGLPTSCRSAALLDAVSCTTPSASAPPPHSPTSQAGPPISSRLRSSLADHTARGERPQTWQSDAQKDSRRLLSPDRASAYPLEFATRLRMRAFPSENENAIGRALGDPLRYKSTSHLLATVFRRRLVSVSGPDSLEASLYMRFSTLSCQ